MPKNVGKDLQMKMLTMFRIAAAFLLICSTSWAESPVEKGEKLFNEYGCAGCHIHGKSWSAPDLTRIAAYYTKERLIDYIVNTKKHYNDPIVKTMAEKYNRYMGDLNVERKDAEAIYEYLKSLAIKGKKRKIFKQ